MPVNRMRGASALLSTSAQKPPSGEGGGRGNLFGHCRRGAGPRFVRLRRLTRTLQLFDQNFDRLGRDRVTLDAAGAGDVDSDGLAVQVDHGAAAVARADDRVV